MLTQTLKIARYIWFVLTNMISAGAFRAAIIYPYFRYQYVLLGILLWFVYLSTWYWRISREKGRTAEESIFRYYWRTRLLKGGF